VKLTAQETPMDLSRYRVTGYSPGRSRLVQVLWYLCSAAVFQSPWFPCSALKVWLLRLFGASVGRGVVIKPCVRIKFPWRLQVGDFVWIGESVWIDNLAVVTIGSNVCLSQGVYLCTGSHDYRSPTFDLITREIQISDRVWVCAMAVVLPGTQIGSDCLLAAHSTVTGVVPSGSRMQPAAAAIQSRRDGRTL
jgi:putative colanic acid biosynthesis acetyltransferase WcaF